MEFTCNAKAINSMLASFLESELAKVIDCLILKIIWDQMSNCYERDNEVKKAKLQGFRMQFESLKMHDVEHVWKYFIGVNEVVNNIGCLLALVSNQFCLLKSTYFHHFPYYIVQIHLILTIFCIKYIN